MLKYLLIFFLIIILTLILFLRNVLELFGLNNYDFTKNIFDQNTYDNLNTNKDYSSYSLFDLWTQDNLNKVKNVSNFINTESQKEDSILNKYSEKIINTGENILNNTLKDGFVKIQDKIDNKSQSDSNSINSQISEETKSYYIDTLKQKYIDEIKDQKIEEYQNKAKEIVANKVTFIDDIINKSKIWLDDLIYKKENILK